MAVPAELEAPNWEYLSEEARGARGAADFGLVKRCDFGPHVTNSPGQHPHFPSTRSGQLPLASLPVTTIISQSLLAFKSPM